MNLKKLITTLTLCAATACLGAFAAPAQAADTALVDEAVTPNLQAAADAMAAALNHLKGATSAPDTTPSVPVEDDNQSTAPDATTPVEDETPVLPDITLPTVDDDTSADDNTGDVTVPDVDEDLDDEVNDVLEGISDAQAQSIIATAMQYLGVPYVYGGTTPAGFDCSGLVQYVFAQNGISLPRTTYEQQAVVTPVSLANLQAGDLVFWGSSAYHVGIYIADGYYIHAPAPGQSVCIQHVDSYAYTSAGRVMA